MPRNGIHQMVQHSPTQFIGYENRNTQGKLNKGMDRKQENRISYEIGMERG